MVVHVRRREGLPGEAGADPQAEGTLIVLCRRRAEVRIAASAEAEVDLGVAQFQLAFPHPTGHAATYFNGVVPRMSEIAGFVHQALAIGRDAGVALPQTPNHRGTILVQVLTKPEGANLYESGHYRGPGGAQLEEELGARRTVTCKLPGYKPGTVEVVFDGKTEAVLCVLQRIKICIEGVKNPFDDCEPAGSAAP